MSTKSLSQKHTNSQHNKQLNHIKGHKDVHLIISVIKKRLITFASE